MPEQEADPVSSKKETTSPQKGSGNKLIIIIAVVVGVFVVFGIASFFVFGFFTEKATETAIEQATGAKVDISDDGDKVTVETDEGKVTIGRNDVPDSFPSDIAVYSGAEVTLTSDTDEGVTLALKTSDSVTAVFDFYKDDLEKNGWNITTSTKVEGSSLITAEKGSNQVIVTVGTDTEDNKTLITILTGSSIIP